MAVASAGPCKSAPRSRQITTPAPHHSFFTGRMPSMLPNQQRQSTEGRSTNPENLAKIGWVDFAIIGLTEIVKKQHQPGGLNKPVLSLTPRLSTRRYPQPQLGRLQLSIDICCPRPGCEKRQMSINGTDRQPDGRTPDRYTDPAPGGVDKPLAGVSGKDDTALLQMQHSIDFSRYF